MAHRLCLTLLLLFARPVLNLMSNEADKVSSEHCSKHTKASKRNSFLWTLEDYPSVYIFGSIHQAYSSIWPEIPRNVKKAFKSSKKVYFEIDLTSPEYLSKINKCQYLPNEQTLTDVLPPRVWDKLQNYLHFVHSQIPEWLNKNEIKEAINADKVFKDMIRNLERTRPIWTLLRLASFNKQYVQARNVPSLDVYMFLKAKESKKSIGHVESAEEHCGLNSLNSSQAIMYLDELLTKYNRARKEKHNLSSGSNLTYHYLCGNLSKYVFSTEINVQTTSPSSRLQTLRKFEDALTRAVLLRRNKQMVRKIIQQVKMQKKRKKRRMFFTIGAAHLIGQRSIIDLLKSKGFKPRHILATDTLPRRYKPKLQHDKKKKSRSKTLKIKVVKSFHTITPMPDIQTGKATTESIILDIYHRSSPVNLALRENRQTCKLFMTFFVSWIVYILIS